jgi:tRNA wybutosine-synthesizing protein 2
MRRLAVVVPKPDSQTAIDGLEAEGVYDDRRKVREHDAGHVELPVTAEPDSVPFERAIAQDDPDPRAPDLGDLLRERGWTDAECDRAPSSWAVLGSVILADFQDCPRPGEVGEALLELHREADTVLDRGEGVDGEHREPAVSVVAGIGDTETVHVEHGTRYALDLAEVMFSPGNKAERARMGDTVEADERVLDMFAGIGYFALPMARAGADVTAVEKNPTAFRFLVENAQLNDVAGIWTPSWGTAARSRRRPTAASWATTTRSAAPSPARTPATSPPPSPPSNQGARSTSTPPSPRPNSGSAPKRPSARAASAPAATSRFWTGDG